MAARRSIEEVANQDTEVGTGTGTGERPTVPLGGPGGAIPRPGTALRDGRYVLERRLGHGGMAAVWLARDELLGRPVAIKVISDTLADQPEYRNRFRREARVAARLAHPNLVNIYDCEASGPRPYLVMEYVEGGDLGTRLGRGEVPEPWRLASELLAALRHIHAARVLHRDVKPQNVLIGTDGRARLTDFGIAQPRDATALTRTGHVLGTERYLAPEVAAGEPASERSDLYSLGVVLAEVLERLPGEADPALRRLVDRLRAPEPAQRPVSAAAALAGLERGDGGVGDTVAGEGGWSESAVGAAWVGEPADPAPVSAGTGRRTGPAPRPETPAPRRVTPAPPQGVSPAAADGLSPAAPDRVSRAGPHGRRRRWLAAGAVALAAAVGVAALVLDGDDPQRSGAVRGGAAAGGPGGQGDRDGSGDAERSQAPPASASQSAEPAPATEDGAAETPPAEPAPPDSTDGVALNDEGYALLQAGDPEAAIPLLEQAVEVLPRNGEITYAYALYNLALAYLETGRPAEAIPLLEERMNYDDGQLAEVEATLKRAYAATGEGSGGRSGGPD